MYSFTGENSTKLYFEALNKLVTEGDSCSPRGKLIKELRPACVEYENPYNRITFLGSRRINPFFQLAEALWIISGRADVEWLTKFNANMSQFSDNGKFFNAPYGERIRAWNKNALHGVIINPIDQLVDAYRKLLADKDTRQAVVVISNPMFDNYSYTVGEQGKDIACNLVFTFKIRHDKLNMTVFNRSNDLHWGVFGANLNQFATIQEVMLNWLKGSGNEAFAELELGTYSQITDSLHIYLDDYGAKATTDVLDYYKVHSEEEVEQDFTCENEPRMTLNMGQFNQFLSTYWNALDPYIMNDDFLQSDNVAELYQMITEMKQAGVLDEYWAMAVYAMIAYRLVKIDRVSEALDILSCYVPNCQWKISMLYFLKSFIYKIGKDELRSDEYNIIYGKYSGIVQEVADSLVNFEYSDGLKSYLEL